MLIIDWSKAKGWAKPQIIPYGPIKLDIKATSLHYGISCYEGMNIVQNR
jgi:branched-chain amino acid aminotransferase